MKTPLVETTSVVAEHETLVEPAPQLSWLPWHRARRSFISVAIPLGALVVAFGVGAILLLIAGADPIVGYRALVHGAFGTRTAVIETFVKTTPILLVALGVAVAFRCSQWNIGAEGQLQLGAVGAAVVGKLLFGWPTIIAVPLMLLTGFLAGGLYASIAGILKAKWEVNEVITTIMMNFVAILFTSYLVYGPLRDPTAAGQPMSAMIAESAQLPRLLERGRLHAGVIIAGLSAIAVYILLWKTTLGYQIRAVGRNPRAARHAGISVPRSIFLAMAISGGLAGLAGMGEIAGIQYRLLEGFSAGFGSTGTVVALLGNLHPALIVPAAILFGALLNGADSMARTVQVSTSIVVVIQGLMVLFVLGSQFIVSKLED
ncbi:MAG: ABC transporter permease [Anaerolineales bacterium]